MLSLSTMLRIMSLRFTNILSMACDFMSVTLNHEFCKLLQTWERICCLGLEDRFLEEVPTHTNCLNVKGDLLEIVYCLIVCFEENKGTFSWDPLKSYRSIRCLYTHIMSYHRFTHTNKVDIKKGNFVFFVCTSFSPTLSFRQRRQ